jgi:crossover junction endodeoxyribonuclease RuvC
VRILGIDPGTCVLGWGVVDLAGRNPAFVQCGALIAPARAPVAQRLALIADQLRAVIAEYAPGISAVEKAFFGKNANAALRVGEARGMALTELARAGVTVEELTPSEVKKAVTGTGGAQKHQVQRMVAALLGCRTLPEPMDASDALALAICLAHRLTAPRSRRSTRRLT